MWSTVPRHSSSFVKSRDLREAYDLTDGEEAMVKKLLATANTKLEKVLGVVHRHKTPEVTAEVEKCSDTANRVLKPFENKMLELHDADDAARVADWVELELSLGEPSISRSKLSSILRDASGVDAAEAFISDVWTHLRRRIARYAVDYFEIHGDVAVRRDDVTEGRLEYQICLLFSLYGAPNQRGSNPKLFERMSAEAICNHIEGKKFVFGWPVLADVQADIAQRVKTVCDLLQERFVEAPNTRYKDRGVDIISWKPFAEPAHDDRRSGQLVILGQCAAGHDWRAKTSELPYYAWTQYVHWAVDPMRSFVVPCVVDDDLWHDIAREVNGLVFDRVRLVNSLSHGVSDAALRTELQNWQTEQIEEYRA